MSKDLNISVLVAARDEYIEQLKSITTPLIMQGFNSIYQDSLKMSSGKKTIYKFQELLKDIPKWNQTILQEESKRIKKKCPYIMDIVTAIFVSNVKILASIRLKGKNDNIRVKIPTSEIFIHSIYIETAQQVFYDPFLFYHKVDDFNRVQKNKKNVVEIIRYSIDETIRQMLPFDNILQEYLANALDDNAEHESESGSEEEEESDSDEESLHGDQIVEDFNQSEEDPEDFDKNPENNIKSFQLDGIKNQHLYQNIIPNNDIPNNDNNIIGNNLLNNNDLINNNLVNNDNIDLRNTNDYSKPHFLNNQDSDSRSILSGGGGGGNSSSSSSAGSSYSSSSDSSDSSDSSNSRERSSRRRRRRDKHNRDDKKGYRHDNRDYHIDKNNKPETNEQHGKYSFF